MEHDRPERPTTQKIIVCQISGKDILSLNGRLYDVKRHNHHGHGEDFDATDRREWFKASLQLLDYQKLLTLTYDLYHNFHTK